MREPNLPPGARRIPPSAARRPAAKPIVPKSVAAKPVAPKPAAAKPAARPVATKTKPAPRIPKRQSRNEIRGRSDIRARLNEVSRFTGKNRLQRAIAGSVIGAVVALVLLVLATIYTPLLAINKIEVVGVHRMKESTVLNAVKSLIGTPLTTVNEAQIQERLASFPLIESFTTVALPPHTLQLDIVERQPIGLVKIGSTNYLYDPAGVQIGPTNNTSKLPAILINGDPSNSPNYREAVSVLLALPASLYPKVASIQATTVDDVRIQLRGISNRKILWGDASEAALKSRVLSALLQNVKHKTSMVIDVSSPSAPTVRYGNF